MSLGRRDEVDVDDDLGEGEDLVDVVVPRLVDLDLFGLFTLSVSLAILSK